MVGSRGMGVSFKTFVKDWERLVEKVCCTAQDDMGLLESLLPSTFLVEGLKMVVMFIQDRFLRV